VTLVVVREVSKIIGAWKYQGPWDDGEGGAIGREEARHFPVCNKLYITLGAYIYEMSCQVQSCSSGAVHNTWLLFFLVEHRAFSIFQ